MNKEFLSLIKDAKLNQKSKEMDIDYKLLYQLSIQHQISAIIYNQIYYFSSFPADLKNIWKKDAININVFQTLKTDRFLRLYQKLLDNDLKVLVVKGLIVRSLYPQPDNRPSNDEDLYVEKKNFDKVKDIFLQEGFHIINESDDVTTFLDTSCGLSIELHTELFSKESNAYGKFQDEFDNAFLHVAIHEINHIQVYSLSYDLHLLFLLLHFVKHFLHGGVGIRQILDIIIYSETYGDKINWSYIYDTLDTLNILILIENIFALSHQYLAFDFDKITLPDHYNINNYDYNDLLNDIIDAGIFGKSSAERLHSSTITLNAMDSGKSSIRKSLFPSIKTMSRKYNYLNKYPILLPVAWLQRIFRYLTSKTDGNSQKTIEIGNQRIELLKKYKIIE